MKFQELEKIYKEHFSLGYFGNTLENKLALIGLICYVTYKAKLKTPDVTYYQVITKIVGNPLGMEEVIKALAIICEDFGYNCNEFPTFGLKGNEIISKIKELFNFYMPF